MYFLHQGRQNSKSRVALSAIGGFTHRYHTFCEGSGFIAHRSAGNGSTRLVKPPETIAVPALNVSAPLRQVEQSFFINIVKLIAEVAAPFSLSVFLRH